MSSNVSSATARVLAPGMLQTAIAARARRFEVDRVDADTELLDQLQAWRLLDDRRRHPLEHVKQDVGVLHFPGERLFVRLVDDGDAEPLALERRDRRAKTWRGAILQNGFHGGFFTGD